MRRGDILLLGPAPLLALIIDTLAWEFMLKLRETQIAELGGHWTRAIHSFLEATIRKVSRDGFRDTKVVLLRESLSQSVEWNYGRS